MAVKGSGFEVSLKRQAKLIPRDCGMLGEKIAMEDEDPAQFDSLCAELEAQYVPRTRMQRELINYIAGHFWRLDRVPALEAALMGVLRNKVAPDEIDSAAEQIRREELDKIANEILRKFGGAVPKEPKKKRRVAARLFRKSESR